MSAGSPGKPGYHGGSDGSRNGRTWQARKTGSPRLRPFRCAPLQNPASSRKGDLGGQGYGMGGECGHLSFCWGEYRALVAILQDGIYKHYTGTGRNLTKRSTCFVGRLQAWGIGGTDGRQRWSRRVVGPLRHRGSSLSARWTSVLHFRPCKQRRCALSQGVRESPLSRVLPPVAWRRHPPSRRGA